MYPESLLYWLGGTAVLIGLLGLIGLLAWAVDSWHRRHADEKRRRTREDGRSAVRTLLEALSAVFVVLALLTAVYSDSRLVRGCAGIAIVVLVSTITQSLIRARELR